MNTLHKVEQTADRLNLSRTTVYGLIRSGQLASVKIGKARRVPDSAINDYINHLKTQATS